MCWWRYAVVWKWKWLLVASCFCWVGWTFKVWLSWRGRRIVVWIRPTSRGRSVIRLWRRRTGWEAVAGIGWGYIVSSRWRRRLCRLIAPKWQGEAWNSVRCR
ncbi:hypothetical protein BC629DRAFT_1525655 [Irpex lacteus]|nr:hypothetical protein BC629DRAFT_1525655 [Irpex lacteus]